MTLQAETRIYKPKNLIYIPKEVWTDSRYPFEENEKVNIKIIGAKLVVEKTEGA